jgi:hypothetical protein
MTDPGEPKPWIRAKVEALRHAEWIGRAGKLFRRTGEAIEKFNDEHVHIDQKMQQAPDVGWKTLQIKSSQTELNLAEAEEKKIAAELAKRTMTAKTRQEEASADLAETNAQLGKIQLIGGLIELSGKLRDAGVIMKLNKEGGFTLLPAPPDYDFKTLTVDVQQSLLAASTSDPPVADPPPQQSDNLHP